MMVSSQDRVQRNNAIFPHWCALCDRRLAACHAISRFWVVWGSALRVHLGTVHLGVTNCVARSVLESNNMTSQRFLASAVIWASGTSRESNRFLLLHPTLSTVGEDSYAGGPNPVHCKHKDHALKCISWLHFSNKTGL